MVFQGNSGQIDNRQTYIEREIYIYIYIDATSPPALKDQWFPAENTDKNLNLTEKIRNQNLTSCQDQKRIYNLGGTIGKKKKKIHLPMQERQETWVRSLGQEDPLEQEMVTRFSILAWKIPWTEEPGGLQWGHKELHTVEINNKY